MTHTQFYLVPRFGLLRAEYGVKVGVISYHKISN